MDPQMTKAITFAFNAWMLLQLFNTPPKFMYVPLHLEDDDDSENPVDDIVQILECPVHDPCNAIRATLHHF